LRQWLSKPNGRGLKRSVMAMTLNIATMTSEAQEEDFGLLKYLVNSFILCRAIYGSLHVSLSKVQQLADLC